MNLTFDIGSPNQPRGHALVYFKDTWDPEKYYATYIVVFPLPINISKYVPPFLASTIGAASVEEISTFPMPPVPEEVEGYDYLLKLARMRNDDLISGGTMSASDVPNAMHRVSEIAQDYTKMWENFDTVDSRQVETEQSKYLETAEGGIGVSEVMYSLYSDDDRLKELSHMVVRIRYASESQDQQLIKDTEAEMRTLGKYLPESYKVERLIEASKDPSPRGTKLAQLYLERCYGLLRDNQTRVQELDQEIQAIESVG